MPASPIARDTVRSSSQGHKKDLLPITMYFMRKSSEYRVSEPSYDPTTPQTIGFYKLGGICIVIVEGHDRDVKIEYRLDTGDR